MNNQEILTKAIEKAIANGWRPWGKTKPADVWVLCFELEYGKEIARSLIFSHPFAKALWGEEQLYTEREAWEGNFKVRVHMTAWQLHLQQMVIADDPIKYLGENT